MKKLIVLLLAAVMVFGVMTVYANPSVGELKEQAVASENTSIDTEGLTDEQIAEFDAILAELADPASGTSFGIVDADIDRYPEDSYTLENEETLTKEDIKKAVETVNDPEAAPMTVAEFLEAMKAGKQESPDAPVTYTVYDGDESMDIPVNVDDYSFVTTFKDLVLSRNGEEVYDFEGKEISTTITIQADFLEGETDPKKVAEDYMIVLINPLTGETVLLTLDEENIDLEKNPPEVKVDFPFLGAFAFIQK